MRAPDELRELVEEYLAELALTPELGEQRDSMRYALEAAASGSGRCSASRPPRRPAPTPETLLPAAAALELVHAFSLVHDDLPALDDDDERRGRPSAHVAFGEGDRAARRRRAARRGLPARALLPDARGRRASSPDATLGMIGGQYLDITGRTTATSPRCTGSRPGAVRGVGRLGALGRRRAGGRAGAVARVRRGARPALPDRRRHPRRRRLRRAARADAARRLARRGGRAGARARSTRSRRTRRCCARSSTASRPHRLSRAARRGSARAIAHAVPRELARGDALDRPAVGARELDRTPSMAASGIGDQHGAACRRVSSR